MFVLLVRCWLMVSVFVSDCACFWFCLFVVGVQHVSEMEMQSPSRYVQSAVLRHQQSVCGFALVRSLQKLTVLSFS